MKQLLIILASIVSFSCHGQTSKQDSFHLTISPIIDQSDTTNLLIIKAATEFLKTKNTSLAENYYWVQSDFGKYIYPYSDLFNIENSKYGKNFFQPTLMELIQTENPSQQVVKLAFIGHNSISNENQIKVIYNLIANINQGEVKFSKYLDYATKHWQTVKKSGLTYKISPRKSVNETEISKQLQDIKKICAFLQCDFIPVTYYSSISPKEIFEIKGFDYNPMMYVDKTGGLTDFGNLIFSGNNSEIYTHEMVHIYTHHLYPNIHKFIDEGFATYFAGSGKFDYAWHRNKFRKFLSENPTFNISEHTDPYERFYYKHETSIPYLAAALILERTMRIYGKSKLIELLKSEGDLWAILSMVGLSEDNLNEALRKEVKQPLNGCW